MYQALVHCSDPNSTLTIAHYRFCLKFTCRPRERIGLCLSVAESVYRTLPAAEECAINILAKTIYAVKFTGEGIEFRRTRFPTPNAILHSRPEIALAILIHTERTATKSALT